MAVTTPADVEAALVRSLTADELAHVDRIISQVEGDVLLRLPGYDLNPASVETVTVTGSYELTLPKYPVAAVSSVMQDGAGVDPASYSWTPLGYLTRHTWSLWPSAYGQTRTHWGSSPVTVTYSHGQGAGGSPLVAVIASMVAGRLAGSGRDGLRSVALGDFSETYADTPGTTGTDQDLAPYRRTSGLVA